MSSITQVTMRSPCLRYRATTAAPQRVAEPHEISSLLPLCISSYRVSTSGSHDLSVAMIFPFSETYCNLWLSRCKLRSQLAATSIIRTSESPRLQSLYLFNFISLQHPTLNACKLKAAPFANHNFDSQFDYCQHFLRVSTFNPDTCH